MLPILVRDAPAPVAIAHGARHGLRRRAHGGGVLGSEHVGDGAAHRRTFEASRNAYRIASWGEMPMGRPLSSRDGIAAITLTRAAWSSPSSETCSRMAITSFMVCTVPYAHDPVKHNSPLTHSGRRDSLTSCPTNAPP